MLTLHSTPIVVKIPVILPASMNSLAPLRESWSMIPAVFRPAQYAIQTAFVGEYGEKENVV